jgi:hypothetical protein
MQLGAVPRGGAIGTIERNGLIGPLLLWGGLAFLLSCWPALVWHGEGGLSGTAWEWNGQSWVACGVWWAILAVLTIPVVVNARKTSLRRTTAVREESAAVLDSVSGYVREVEAELGQLDEKDGVADPLPRADDKPGQRGPSRQRRSLRAGAPSWTARFGGAR